MPIYSHSRLATYETCPLQYRYAYVEKVELEPEIETIEIFMGSRVHEALEKLYRDLKLSKVNVLEDLLAHYEENWEKNWSEDVKIVRKEYSEQNYRDTGRKCITDYYDRYKPFSDSRTLGLEQIILIEIEGYRLRGFIDRLAQKSDGYYEIHDYKTSQYLPMQRYFDEDRQLALYQMGVENLWGDAKSVDLIWHYLVHDKEIRSRRSAEAIEKLKAEVAALIERIEMAEEEGKFPAKESELCSWCEYQVLCPRHKHIVATSEMPVNKFLKDPGVKLVNQYARLVEEKRAFLDGVEAEMEQLKEAIIAYAKREGVEVIRGSDKKLSVKIDTKAKFPTKEEEERAELDALLKNAGKWMEVSDLNVYALARAMQRGGWSQELVKKIEKYQKLEEQYRLTLSALREEE
ncbi:MAG: PD-(D/E)XK nuclease family protein [Euryarchaeota archaeon]|nr:PD-(D/E)XK nuclease family protein [Euryarchaeota archaeon]